MLKILIIISIVFLALLGGLPIPVDASPPDTYSVGTTSWNRDGVMGSSVVITANPSHQEFPELTAENLAKAKTALTVGNKLYYSESLRGKTIIMAVYMKKELIFSEFPDFAPSIVHVRDLYQDNQKILGYQPYYLRQ